MSIINPTCPTDCTTELPDPSFSYCSPIISFGEINKIYLMGEEGTPFINLDLSELISKKAMTGADKLVELTVMGNLPAVLGDDIEISNGRKATPPKTFTLPFTIDEVNAANYEFMRTMSCIIRVRAYFATPDWWYGGKDGIPCDIKMAPQIDAGTKSKHLFSGQLTWESVFPSERITNPMV
jgi:hypothetical protein